MDYRLIRSRRKTIAICIGRDGEVVVRAPLKADRRRIDAFVHEKQGWIEEKSTLMAENAAARREFRIAPGSALPFLGKEYPVLPGEQVAFDGKSFFLPDGDFETLKPQIIRLYQSIAVKVISERMNDYVRQTGLTPSGVRIGSANTRWGSCSGKNRLSFSWKLILAPLEQVDYVIVQELAHTREHNHSQRFWKLVAQILPDYQLRQKKLKAVARELQKQDWD